MKVMGAIIAGGKSSRMGGHEKAFLDVAGAPLLAHVMARLAPQVDEVMINSNGVPFRFARFNVPVIPDHIDDLQTPLAGIHASMAHAAKHDAEVVVTVPSDTPFLPGDLVQRLMVQMPAVASSGGQDHYVVGAWPVGLLHDLETAIHTHRLFRVRDWAKHCHAARVEWPTEPHDPFFNINTPGDLTRAESLIRHG
jgi:molybdenum cofactor guanylyltransferase